MVWKTSREEFDSKCIIPTVKQVGGLGLFHLSGSWKAVYIMDRANYRDILKQNLQPLINRFKLGHRCIFIYDNDLKHTLVLIKD